jgi:predicted trehalose synthase
VLATLTGARKGLLFDGSLDDRFARTLLEAIEREEQITMKRGVMRSLRTTRFAAARGAADEDLRVWRLGAEQSNTSIAYGERLILKLFRRLEAGVNPDYEVSHQLTEKIGFPRVPAIAGALEYNSGGTAPLTIGMMQQLVESQADGWTHATDELDRFYDHVENSRPPRGRLPVGYTDLVEADVPKAVQEAMGGYLETAAVLGRRTAEMHLALAADSGNPACARATVRVRSRRCRHRRDRAGTGRTRYADGHGSVTRDETPSRRRGAGLASRGDARRAARAAEAGFPTRIRGIENPRARRLPPRAGALGRGGLLHVRLRGRARETDRHAPGKAERSEGCRGNDSIVQLRRICGSVRAWARRPGEFERLEPWARIWQTWATAAFLRAYFATADRALFVPALPAQRDALLRLFVLGKALYELHYELNNRPDWVRIPLLGIFEILNAE